MVHNARSASIQPLRVLYVAAECTPWCSTGGLGEVTQALPQALMAAGATVAVCIPLYRDARRKIGERGGRLQDTGATASVWMGGHRLTSRWYRVIPAESDAIASRAPTFACDCPQLFDRDGLYGHGDDDARFSTFCRAALSCSAQLLGGKPHVVHAHDWHTALLPLYLAGGYRQLLPRTRSVLSIHNLAYQGLFPANSLPTIGVGPEWFHADALEFYGAVNWMKGGIAAADAITTVSPRYAEEIQTAEFGERLEGVLRRHRGKLTGILNGIDMDLWNPATDPLLPYHFSQDDLAGKAATRRHLLELARMDPDDPHPVFVGVSRLVAQKGFDLVAELIPYLASRSVRFILLGRGSDAMEYQFHELERFHWPHFRFHPHHDLTLSHVLYAAGDAVLMPSRWEPCGLTQLYAMRYGTVPIVRAVGGLRDTVVHASQHTLGNGTANGFAFEHDTVAGLQWAIDRALDVFYDAPETWRAIQHNGMRRDSAWRGAAEQYLGVYRQILGR